MKGYLSRRRKKVTYPELFKLTIPFLKKRRRIKRELPNLK